MKQQGLDIANKVVGRLPEEDRKQFGIVEIVQLATALVSLYTQCKNAHLALAATKRPGLFQRMKLKRAISQHIQSKSDVNKLVQAALDAGKGATEDDVRALLQAAGENTPSELASPGF